MAGAYTTAELMGWDGSRPIRLASGAWPLSESQAQGQASTTKALHKARAA